MTDKEKIINGLECCSKGDCADCDNCTYYGVQTDVPCESTLMREALTLLKTQEPRVMTVSEIGALANGDVVWVEFTDGRLLPMMVEDGYLMRWRSLWRICEDAFYDEDYKARAWTSRPDQATREATPWN